MSESERFIVKILEESEMTKIVEIVEGIMGSGKSTGIINWMENNPNEKYIYVSPLLSEVGEGGRLSQALKSITFEYPVSKNKADDVLDSLKLGKNIACTHVLYSSLSAEHLKYIEDEGYILVIDEEISLITGVSEYGRGDYKWLFENDHIEVSSETGQVYWKGDEVLLKDNKYFKFKTYCDNQSLYVTKRDQYMMVSQLPIRLLDCAKRVIILTYMFEGNVLDSFLKIKGLKVVPFTEIELQEVDVEKVKNLITLIKPPKHLLQMNQTSSWYDNKATNDDLNEIGKFIRNCAIKNKATRDDVIYTHPKNRFDSDSKSRTLIKPLGYYKKKIGDEENVCWLASSTKATNLYADRWCLVHCYNRYPQTPVEAYINDYGSDIGVKLNAEVFALSELLQWVWRSRIRKSEPIVLAIGNTRMCRIFTKWLDNL